jgi:hypothetical protein
MEGLPLYKELRLWFILTSSIFSILFMFAVVPSSVFLSVNPELSKTYTDGYVEFERLPLYDGIVLRYNEEVVTEDGRNCTINTNESSYEARPDTIYIKGVSNVDTQNKVKYQIDPRLMPCLEEGSIHRSTRQFWYFRPTITETTVLPAEDRLEN